jgi:hypothetical protein
VKILAWRRSTFAQQGRRQAEPDEVPVIACGNRDAFAQESERFARMRACDERNCSRSDDRLGDEKTIRPRWRIDCFRRRSSSHRRTSRFARNDGRCPAQGGDPASWEQNFRLDVLGAVNAFEAARSQRDGAISNRVNF